MEPTAVYQIATQSYDEDTGLLELTLTDGSEFVVTNAGHARTVFGRIPMGTVSAELRHWLERYRAVSVSVDKRTLCARLGMLRVELQTKR